MSFNVKINFSIIQEYLFSYHFCRKESSVETKGK